MFIICIDENGYYKQGNNGELVDVVDIPGGVDLTMCKYDRETKTLVLPNENALKPKK